MPARMLRAAGRGAPDRVDFLLKELGNFGGRLLYKDTAPTVLELSAGFRPLQLTKYGDVSILRAGLSVGTVSRGEHLAPKPGHDAGSVKVT